MPPAFYKYGDNEVIDFYSRLIDAHPECEIILYNFEKLCGYKFSLDCIYELVKKLPYHQYPFCFELLIFSFIIYNLY